MTMHSRHYFYFILTLAALFGNSTLSFAAEANSSDKFAQVRGFKVEISGSSGKEVDTAWESVSGGDMVIELTETTIGADKFRTNSPGHKSVGEITLRRSLTEDSTPMMKWFLECQKSRNCGKDIKITPVRAIDEKRSEALDVLSFQDCNVVNIDFKVQPSRPFGVGDETVQIQCSLNRESRARAQESFQTLQNISKARHDIALNAIRNMK